MKCLLQICGPILEHDLIRIKEVSEIHTGSQKVAIVTPKAKIDIQRQGKKYGNLHKFQLSEYHHALNNILQSKARRNEERSISKSFLTFQTQSLWKIYMGIFQLAAMHSTQKH